MAPPDEPLAAGQVVGGRYTIERPLGEGGMGQVYLAHHRVINKRVAIKVMLPHVARHPEVASRFLREAQAASGIDSRYVVDVLDFGELEDGAPFMVMEFAPGVSLAERLESERALSLDDVRTVGRQICQGLRAAHEAGIVHRDLKPENITLEEQGEEVVIKILDFGVAKVADSMVETKLTMPGAVIGTPHYMAPEQCEGSTIDPRTDVYALGVILYEMTTGVTPFDGATPMDVIRQQMLTAPPPPSSLCEEFPPDLEALILKCLAKSPDDRPASMHAVEKAIEALGMSGDEALRPSGHARMVDTFSATARDAKRNRKTTRTRHVDSIGMQLAVSVAVLALIGAIIYGAVGMPANGDAAAAAAAVGVTEADDGEAHRRVRPVMANVAPTFLPVSPPAPSTSTEPHVETSPRRSADPSRSTRSRPPTRARRSKRRIDGVVDPWASSRR